ncbi:low specificity L-threonine aldolase [Actinobacteria bacterium YIM 96077]|uniref:Low specificity L-threonine aldolase n=1 Tax=Phytoactinopolyspora halophila TaxID=1981511 RepID=A0A329QGW7_9ACTN|nr:GntG family PLP-dependent aldolase [Phytoactinopolyspora halophila]AYY13647.1 low specificity L-threonine aldolase [Actinobacteria bacterium YIM 96077]RAW11211.1 low specificity L-threonine aldolase [Phytoactinopolyspora halophila]
MTSGSIDLRSDTVTRPAPGMVAAMSAADVGDDVYGEDPAANALEERVAGLLGHEAGLFTVTGSLANVLGVRAWVAPGQELLCEARAHVVRAELGAHAALHGVTTRTWSHPRGRADREAIRELMSPGAGPYLVSTAAIGVENTHNFAGGTVHPVADMAALRDLVQGTGIRLHLDGARLWNAQVATGVSAREYAEHFDTVSVCLSKGLGAPIGSVLVGPADVIAEARQWRKRLGGGWRQAGVLAAAGWYALDHRVDRLADDHTNARLIADLIHEAAGSVVDPESVETNIVLLHVGRQAERFVARARAQGVLVASVAPGVVRLITHLDVSAADARKAGETLAAVARDAGA